MFEKMKLNWFDEGSYETVPNTSAAAYQAVGSSATLQSQQITALQNEYNAMNNQMAGTMSNINNFLNPASGYLGQAMAGATGGPQTDWMTGLQNAGQNLTFQNLGGDLSGNIPTNPNANLVDYSRSMINNAGTLNMNPFKGTTNYAQSLMNYNPMAGQQDYSSILNFNPMAGATNYGNMLLGVNPLQGVQNYSNMLNFNPLQDVRNYALDINAPTINPMQYTQGVQNYAAQMPAYQSTYNPEAGFQSFTQKFPELQNLVEGQTSGLAASQQATLDEAQRQALDRVSSEFSQMGGLYSPAMAQAAAKAVAQESLGRATDLAQTRANMLGQLSNQALGTLAQGYGQQGTLGLNAAQLGLQQAQAAGSQGLGTAQLQTQAGLTGADLTNQAQLQRAQLANQFGLSQGDLGTQLAINQAQLGNQFGLQGAQLQAQLLGQGAQLGQQYGTTQADLAAQLAQQRASLANQYGLNSAQLQAQMMGQGAQLGQDYSLTQAQLAAQLAQQRAALGNEFSINQAQMGNAYQQSNADRALQAAIQQAQMGNQYNLQMSDMMNQFGLSQADLANQFALQRAGMGMQNEYDWANLAAQTGLGAAGQLGNLAGVYGNLYGNQAGLAGSLMGNLTPLMQAQYVAPEVAYQPSAWESWGANLTGQLGGALFNAAGTAIASDKRLKENIELLETVEDVNLYRFNYRGSKDPQVGVIAQEIKDRFPEAVSKDQLGYYFVRYNLLPAEIRKRRILLWQSYQAAV